MIAAFVVALSVIVAIHEYGHYIVGRWCGIHAEVFSIGFGPVLFRRVDRRGTQWQIAVLPLGGYVRFRGDADPASMCGDSCLILCRPCSHTLGTILLHATRMHMTYDAPLQDNPSGNATFILLLVVSNKIQLFGVRRLIT